MSILNLMAYSLLPCMPLPLQVKPLMNLMSLASLKYLLEQLDQENPSMTLAVGLRHGTVFLRATLYYHLDLRDQMPKYQVNMSEYAFKYHILQVLKFDVAVRRAIATDPDRLWDDRHQNEFDRFLAGHLLSCYGCNGYGHYTSNYRLGAGYSGSKQQTAFLTNKKTSHTATSFGTPTSR